MRIEPLADSKTETETEPLTPAKTDDPMTSPTEPKNIPDEVPHCPTEHEFETCSIPPWFRNT